MNFIHKYSGPDRILKHGSGCSRIDRKLALNPTRFSFSSFLFFDCMMVSGCLVLIVANSLLAICQDGVGPKKTRCLMQQQQLQHGDVINNRKIAP